MCQPYQIAKKKREGRTGKPEIPFGTREAEQRQPVFTKDELKFIKQKFITVVCTPQLAESLKMYYEMCLHVCVLSGTQVIKHPCLKDVLQTISELFGE